MDNGERIARVEAVLDVHSARFDRLERAIVRLQELADRGSRDVDEPNCSAAHKQRNKRAKWLCEMKMLRRWLAGIFILFNVACVGLLIKIALET